MKNYLVLIGLVCCFILPNGMQAQVDEDKLGAWYIYIWSTQFKESEWGLQGDVQYRNWDLIGDLEQLLLRGAATYKPKNTNITLALGYAHITTGTFGESNSTTAESRIYQEANLPQKLGGKLAFNHRFRYEQRFVDGQDFRTRFRYGLFLTIPLKGKTVEAKSWYLNFYNELFINGERNIGDGRQVQLFDRNRLYGALGYAIKKNFKAQVGAMRQTTNSVDKVQLQFGVFHNF